MSQLKETLEAFALKLNGHEQIVKSLAGWDRNLHLESPDTGEKYCMIVENQQARLSEELVEPRHVLLVGQNTTMIGIFKGELSPQKEYTAGRLRFKGGIKDEMKLDMMVEVLWK